MTSGTDKASRVRRVSSSTALSLHLAVGVVAVLLGGALLILSTFAAHILGYVVAGVCAPVAVALGRRNDVARLADHGVAPARLRSGIAVAVLVAGLAVALVHGWAVAWELAREVNA